MSTPNTPDSPNTPNFAIFTAAGQRRNVNEDSLGTPEGVDPALLKQKGWLFVVADGVSGYVGAQEASVTAVHTMMEEYYQDTATDPAVSLEKAIVAANTAVFQRGRGLPDAGMRTSMVAAVLRDNELVVASVGDSRAYLLQGKRLRQITTDHKWVVEQVQKGLIADAEAAGHPFGNILTRTIGEKEGVQVDIQHQSLSNGEALLLCSDGLYNEVPDSAIERVLLAAPSPAAAARQLGDLASQAGGSNDISLVVVRAARASSPKAVLAGSNLMVRVPLALAALALLLVVVAIAWSSLSAPAAPAPTPTVRAASAATATVAAPAATATRAPVAPTLAATPTVAVTPTAVRTPAATVAPGSTPTTAPRATSTAVPGRPSFPTTGVISVARWSMATAVIYSDLPMDRAGAVKVGEIADATKVDVLDLKDGWNVYPNDTDGKQWYQIRYKDAGKDKTGWVHASALALAGQ
jgi:PPM family protein phosphatase